MLASITMEHFQPLVGSHFTVEFPNRTFELELTQVKSLADRFQNRMNREPFRLLFRGPSDVILPQATYAMKQDAFPEPLTIFIVPIGKDESGVSYEAIFA